MRWSRATWTEISSATIKSCFHHTGLTTDPAERQEAGAGTALQEEAGSMQEQLVVQEYEAASNGLQLWNPMSLACLLKLVEEDKSAHTELTDAEIIKLVQEPEEEEEGAALREKIKRVFKAETLNDLNLTISLLDPSHEDHRVAHCALRLLQFDIRTTSTT